MLTVAFIDQGITGIKRVETSQMQLMAWVGQIIRLIMCF